MADTHDLIVIGMGVGGEEVTGRAAEAGMDAVGIERQLVGGEFPYRGCIPSKLTVRAANALAEAGLVGRLAGRVGVTPDWSPVVARIREATAGCDDRLAVEPATPPIDGLDPDAPAVAVDANLRAGDGIRAVGDVTGTGAFTHVAVYQGRPARAGRQGADPDRFPARAHLPVPDVRARRRGRAPAARMSQSARPRGAEWQPVTTSWRRPCRPWT